MTNYEHVLVPFSGLPMLERIKKPVVTLAQSSQTIVVLLRVQLPSAVKEETYDSLTAELKMLKTFTQPYAPHIEVTCRLGDVITAVTQYARQTADYIFLPHPSTLSPADREWVSQIIETPPCPILLCQTPEQLHTLQPIDASSPSPYETADTAAHLQYA